MALAIGIYLKLQDADGNDTGNQFQNFFQGETRQYNGDEYMFGAFGFSGGTLDIQAANIQANLIFALNGLSLAVFSRAATEFWLARIRTVWLDPETFEEGETHSEELYAITGLEHDSSRLSVRLSSPLDAVQQNVPRRVLSLRMVGELPSTGDIKLS